VFTRQGNTDTDMTITFSTTDGSAAAGEDYVAAANQTVTILAGQTNAKTQIGLIGDVQAEGNEIFSVVIESAVADGAIVTLADAEATVTLTDNDLPKLVDPTGAIEAFDSQSDLETSAIYSNGEVGSALLEVMTGQNNIQASNYGTNSFEVTNTGQKKIAALFINVENALYPDSVFDPDGLGGDNAAKAWAVNSDGNTGGYISGAGYFLPGIDPIPNFGGSGGASNGGYRGAMVKFNPNNSNGFEFGETVGFSGDMDPNSIAGMSKGDVDGSAILSWDVGGISGHEIIGSLFTVLFDDGSTASGMLASDGSSAGSQAVATEAATDMAPGLTVNGVDPGNTGTYGGTAPSVIVTGNPGDVVRITLSKGFDPVTEPLNGIDSLVEARLQKYDFKASNAFDVQSVEVTIGSTGTFDASSLFDYNDAVNNNVGSGSFAGDDVQSIAFVATKIEAGGQQLPLGATTSAIYLDNVGGPVVGDPNTAVDTLSLVTYQVSVMEQPTGGTIRAVISAGSDDTDQNAGGGAVDLTKPNLELGDAGRDIGLRFTGLDLESLAGNNITSAYIEFTNGASGGSSGTIDAVIALENSFSTETFSTASKPADRDQFVFNTDWVDSIVPDSGEVFRTEDISDMLEAFIGSFESGLSNDDDLTFIITDNAGIREISSFEGGNAPKLVIEWDII
jgi:hypothetical protein